jgi:CRISPR system Cascade subunit CasA
MKATPSYNLWSEPWITVETPGGEIQAVGVREALLNAHDYTAVYDTSPLVVVGIQRLLMAILQDMLRPRKNRELDQLWARGRFPADKVASFEKQYEKRFDLFSSDKPFLQSADIPLFPQKKAESNTTTVAKLFPELPSGTFLRHYRHTLEDDCVFSPATAAKGLVSLPPFVSSGGAGLMPSINGVPPVYVLPGGSSLFASLVASLMSESFLEDYYPHRDKDLAWWDRPSPVIVKGSKKKGSTQLSMVGYLHGLTFPARKVRLHPERLSMSCSRSGESSQWCVRTMTFRMGESCRDHPDRLAWRDPFVAYRLPLPPKPVGNRKRRVRKKPQRGKPLPVRPRRGFAVWREFSALFMQAEGEKHSQRPLFLDQLAQLVVGKTTQTHPFRCVAVQTDGKMKFFEWMDFGFDVPSALLQDPDGAIWCEHALEFAAECSRRMVHVFADILGHKAKNAERFKRIKDRMESDYWADLAGRFRQLVLELGDVGSRREKLESWFSDVASVAQREFEAATNAVGNDGNSLRLVVQARAKCLGMLKGLKAKYTQGG